MPDDQVTIDPQFRLPAAGEGSGRWLRSAGIGLVAVAAFVLGWLFQLPNSGESEGSDLPPIGTAAPTSAPTRATTSPTTAAPTTTTTLPEPGELAVPLGEAVPGFTDTITIAVHSYHGWGEEAVEVIRWPSSRAAPETIVSSADLVDDRTSFIGLDAAGAWYALRDADGVLSVWPVAAAPDDDVWSAPMREVVGLRVVGASWHDTEPGRLAWVSCSRVPGGPGTLYTLDVVDWSAEAQQVTSIPNACGDFAGAWLDRWGDWGFAFRQGPYGLGEDGQEQAPSTVLLDPGGVEIARIEGDKGEAEMIASGPDGTIWTEEAPDGASSFMLSLDGRERTPVSGLSGGEWIDGARWSPDGSRVAVVRSGARVDDQSIRIVDTANDETVAEIDESGSAEGQPCWSRDGRFLLYRRDHEGGGRTETALVVYDTVAGAVVAEVPFLEPEASWEIRTFDPASVVRQIIPVEWRIALDDAGPGVHLVYMLADVRPLTPDQIEDPSGRLVWDETVVDLCYIQIRGSGAGSVDIGDIFQTTEGCGDDPAAMQEAFDEFGVPDTACVSFRSGGNDHTFCAPLG